ncbi:unnamed protein product [Tuber melanosporum]|uniref:(Perigord truffle) hypothetical protein n=1 Tax=Tuber melanosporum (strain Mel28) TaxID=656061 RepID=D5GG18_TUBMM|nr:uncharacterized protein GSTUM_00007158001 [Tuber melanosporum]CAZ83461.1 unnamed protein product [Tuber melanosporum]
MTSPTIYAPATTTTTTTTPVSAAPTTAVVDDHNPASPPKEHLLDPALDIQNQHHHSHLHHSAAAYAAHNPAFEPSYVIDCHAPPRFSHEHSHDVENHAAALAGEPGKGDDAVEGGSVRSTGEGSGRRPGKAGVYYRKYKPFVHLFIFALFTGWWIASLVLHRHDKNWIIPFLLWLSITLRIITFWLPAHHVLRPAKFLWSKTAIPLVAAIPPRFRIAAGATLVISVFLLGSFISEESLNNTRDNRAVSLFGLLVFIGALTATSRNRRKIKWRTVLVGMLMQFIIALFVLRTGAGFDIFTFVSDLARSLLGFSRDGTAFLTSPDVAKLPYFFIGVLPAIIFFVALVQLLYYWGVLQWFIGKFASFFFWSMQVSGAEAVVAAASPFVGQGESAMLIRPFVAHLTQAEIHQVMTSGFATIAGSVLVAYISMGVNPQALISSCVMSIPASLAVSKLRYPETEESLTAGKVVIPEDENSSVNSLHAFADGAWLGLKIAGMVMTILLCVLALLGLVNGLLTWWGRYLNINDPPLTVELIVGYICYPISFLLGVSREGDDIYKVAQLIGTKLIANEFVAYTRLQSDPDFQTLSDRSRLIAVYALCGFANIGSLGGAIGVLSQIAPSRSGDVSRLAISALIAGAISTLTSASVAGLVVTNQRQFTATPAGP